MEKDKLDKIIYESKDEIAQLENLQNKDMKDELHFSIIGKYNFINDSGTTLSEDWFDYCGNFINGHAIVKLDGLCNFITTGGKIISQDWFKSVRNFSCGYAEVQNEHNKWNFINTNGDLLSNIWFKKTKCFKHNITIVHHDLIPYWIIIELNNNDILFTVLDKKYTKDEFEQAIPHYVEKTIELNQQTIKNIAQKI